MEQAEIFDSTLIIVTADHGGEGGGHSDATPLDKTIPWFLTAVGAFVDAKVQGVCISKQEWEYEETVEEFDDGSGYLRYTDTNVVPGTRYGYRLGIVDGGEEVFAGEVWATAEQPPLLLARVRPNPTPGNRVVVEFTLPSREPATLGLFDVSGRPVSRRDVGAMGPGRHQVDLADGVRLHPGIYLVRLTQRQETLVSRVVVVD